MWPVHHELSMDPYRYLPAHSSKYLPNQLTYLGTYYYHLSIGTGWGKRCRNVVQIGSSAPEFQWVNGDLPSLPNLQSTALECICGVDKRRSR